MNDHQRQPIDAIDFLTKKENKFLVDIILSNNLESKLLYRILLLKSFLDGLITGKEAFWGLLPNILRTKSILNEWNNPYLTIAAHYMASLMAKYSYMDESIDVLNYRWYYTRSQIRANIAEKHIKSFSFFNLIDLVGILAFVKNIILYDQYCAKEFLNLDEQKIIFDCGANIGIFSLWAHHLSPKSQIYAFEPTKSTFDVLEKNIKMNILNANILACNMALGDIKKETVIRVDQAGLGSDNSIIDSNFITPATSTQKITMITLDDFVKEYDLPKVDFIKMDTEGYEKQIIKGAAETIKNFSPVIVCSAYHFKNDKIEIPKLVKSINSSYRFRLRRNGEEDLVCYVE